MLYEVLIALFAGIGFGIFTGLTPGVHINLVSVLVVSVAPSVLIYFSPLSIAVFVVSMGVTHAFLDIIPSIFLGAPDDATILNVLPGHRMLLSGKGFEAVYLSLVGSFIGLVCTVILIPLTIPALPAVQEFLSPVMSIMLLWVTLMMVLTESGWTKKLYALLLVFLSGILGMIVLGAESLSEPLFPLLSGLFGTSQLITAVYERINIPLQKTFATQKIGKLELARTSITSVFCGSLVGLLPGVGSSTAAMIATYLVGGFTDYTFLILTGGIGTANFAFSLAAFYSIEKARNGAIAAVMQILPSIGLQELIILCLTCLVAGGTSVFLTLWFARTFAKWIAKVNYPLVCLCIMLFIAVLVVIISDISGFFVLITATALGMIPPLIGVKRSTTMACIMVPVMLFFFGLR